MGELAGAVVLGIGATITPCVLPLYPAFLAYLTGQAGGPDAGRALPPAVAASLVWAGVVAGMVAFRTVRPVALSIRSISPDSNKR